MDVKGKTTSSEQSSQLETVARVVVPEAPGVRGLNTVQSNSKRSQFPATFQLLMTPVELKPPAVAGRITSGFTLRSMMPEATALPAVVAEPRYRCHAHNESNVLNVSARA